MSIAIERLVNLALYFAASTRPVTAEQIRTEVIGYPADQDEAAFLRMFERDKEDLRQAGLTIDSDEQGRYLLDRSATFAAPLDLSAEEAAVVRIAGSALLGDPSFPFAKDLRLALAKISAGLGEGTPPSVSHLADENPEKQGASVAQIADAAGRCKRMTFDYTNSYGATAGREVEPYGLFLHEGRWYLVGRDTSADSIRTYTVARADNITVNAGRPKSADFTRPEDFDVRTFVCFPFQYGSAADEFEAVLRFAPSVAWRAERLAAGHGVLSEEEDGPVGQKVRLWRVSAHSRDRVLRFAIEHGPGVSVVAPPALAAEMRAGLERVAALHG
ncbi:MAG: WYL domain-containing protein [Coriobacteriia bacterium]|nr:WYL domain-containing protein [Coriobacteriia bacterium]